MKIAILAGYPIHLLPGMEDHRSGAHYATWLPQLSKNFEKLMDPTDQIHWIVMVKGIDKRIDVSHNGQQFHLIPRFKLSVSIATKFFSDKRKIRSVIDEIEPDLVHGWGTEDAYGQCQADWKGPSILSMQGILSHYWKISKGPILARLLAYYEPETIRRSTMVTSESPWGKARVKEIAPKVDVELVEYGANPVFFDVQKKLSEKPTFVYVGSLDYRKGTDVLAKAFSDPRLSGMRLVVLGDGPMRPLLEECGENVELLGRVPPERVRKLLGESWALIHPARADTSPNSVKEARVSGLAIISTELGGQAQYVEDGKSGVFIDPEDAETLIGAVEKISSDPEVANEMGLHKRTAYQALLDPSKTATDFLALYRRLVSAG